LVAALRFAGTFLDFGTVRSRFALRAGLAADLPLFVVFAMVLCPPGLDSMSEAF
jgi:hypothetical protein